MATNTHDKDQLAQPPAATGKTSARQGTSRQLGRRSFLRGGVAAAGTVSAGAALLSSQRDAAAQGHGGGLTAGDAAILRFLAAAEIIESDLWQQYNELAGIQDAEVPGGSGNPLDDLTGALEAQHRTLLRVLEHLSPAWTDRPPGAHSPAAGPRP